MNTIRLTFILLSVLIGIIHCSIVVRRQDQNVIDPFEIIRDNYGCDAVVGSCGKNGKCCDMHDACYKLHQCTAISWFYLCKLNLPIYCVFYICDCCCSRGKLSKMQFRCYGLCC